MNLTIELDGVTITIESTYPVDLAGLQDFIASLSGEDYTEEE